MSITKALRPQPVQDQAQGCSCHWPTLSRLLISWLTVQPPGFPNHRTTYWNWARFKVGGRREGGLGGCLLCSPLAFESKSRGELVIMKMPGPILILAVLSALVPAAAAAIEMSFVTEPPQSGKERQRPPFRPGRFSLISSIPKESLREVMQHDPRLESLETLLGAIEAGIPEESLREVMQHERHLESLGTRLSAAAEVPIRIRREEKKVVTARRRGKSPRTRPVCRGCFSGLMLMGQPAQGGKKGNLPGSLSESGGDSSRGD